jgi:hypothetical protein
MQNSKMDENEGSYISREKGESETREEKDTDRKSLRVEMFEFVVFNVCVVLLFFLLLPLGSDF